MLSHMSKPFHKATYMAVIDLERIPIAMIASFPYDFAYGLALRERLAR